MYVRKLHLQDFCGYTDDIFEFKSKIIAITGRNGRGKSKILSAINYALTDHLEENIEEYINWNGKATEFRIAEDFEHQNAEYRLEIVGKKGGTEKKLWFNGNGPLVNSKATQGLKKIVNPKLALYSNVAIQQNSVGLLFEKPAPRLEKLKELLSLHVIDDIAKRISFDIDEDERKIKTLRFEILTLKNNSYNFLPEIVVEKINVEEAKKQIEDLLQKKKEIEDQKRKYEQYESNLKKHTEISTRISEILHTIDFTENQIKQLIIPEEKDFDQASYDKLYIQKLNLEKEKTAFETQLNEYNKNVSEKTKLEALIRDLESQRDEIKLRRLSPIAATAESQEKLLQEISTLQSSLGKLNKDKSLIEQGKCETCGQDFHGDIQHTLGHIEETKKKIAQLTEEYNSNKIALASYNEAIQQQSILSIKKENIQSKIDEANSRYSKYSNLEIPLFSNEQAYIDVCKEIDTFAERKREFDENKENISKLIFLKESLEDSIKSNQSLVIQLKAQQEMLDVTPCIKPDDFDEKYFNDLNNSLLLYDERLKERDRIQDHNTKIRQRKINDEQDIVLKEQTIQELTFHMNTLKDTLKIVSKEFASFLIDEGAAYIKEQLNFFFQRVYNRYFIDFRKDKNSVDFLYSPDNKNFRSVGMASGFERVLLAMAFRVALMNMTGLGLLSLDEVDADADDDNSIELYQNLLQVPFNQMFCITHRKSTIEFLENDHGAQIIAL